MQSHNDYSDVAFVEQVLLVQQGLCGTGMIWELEQRSVPAILPRIHLSTKNCVDGPDGSWTLSSHLIEEVLILRWFTGLIEPESARKRSDCRNSVSPVIPGLMKLSEVTKTGDVHGDWTWNQASDNQHRFAILVRDGTSSRIIQGSANRYTHSRVQTRNKTELFLPSLIPLDNECHCLTPNWQRNGYCGYISESPKKMIQKYNYDAPIHGILYFDRILCFGQSWCESLLQLAGGDIPHLAFAQESGSKFLTIRTPTWETEIVQWDDLNTQHIVLSQSGTELS